MKDNNLDAAKKKPCKKLHGFQYFKLEFKLLPIFFLLLLQELLPG